MFRERDTFECLTTVRNGRSSRLNLLYLLCSTSCSDGASNSLEVHDAGDIALDAGSDVETSTPEIDSFELYDPENTRIAIARCDGGSLVPRIRLFFRPGTSVDVLNLNFNTPVTSTPDGPALTGTPEAWGEGWTPHGSFIEIVCGAGLSLNWPTQFSSVWDAQIQVALTTELRRLGHEETRRDEFLLKFDDVHDSCGTFYAEYSCPH